MTTLQAPDRALRERLVRRWLLEAGQEPSHGLVAFLADREASGVRELLGLMTRLHAAADLVGRPLTLELAQRELGVAHHDVTIFPSRTREAGTLDEFFRDREKVIWEWPDLAGRVIEEYR